MKLLEPKPNQTLFWRIHDFIVVAVVALLMAAAVAAAVLGIGYAIWLDWDNVWAIIKFSPLLLLAWSPYIILFYVIKRVFFS